VNQRTSGTIGSIEGKRRERYRNKIFRIKVTRAAECLLANVHRGGHFTAGGLTNPGEGNSPSASASANLFSVVGIDLFLSRN